MPVQFIFFWRLEPEKWCDLVCDVLEQNLLETWVHKQSWKDAHFFFCWSGSLEKRILWLTSRFSNIHYFWRCSQEELIQKVMSCHFTLMPSRFLETFGLTALESLSLWVPVIWYQKWWTDQFIPDYLAINKQQWSNDKEKLSHIINWSLQTFEPSQHQKRSIQSATIAKSFTAQSRYNKIKKHFPNSQNHKVKILLVSDYITAVGWIETHIETIQSFLHQEWHECITRWSKLSSNQSIQKIQRIANMFLSSCNRFAKSSIQKLIDAYQPDIIRRHSTLRNIWPMWMDIQSNATQQMTYHDLWYISFKPSLIHTESDIPTERTRQSFRQQHTTQNTSIYKQIREYPLLAYKYRLCTRLHKIIKKNISTHFVPSAFMTKHISNLIQIDKKSITTLPHFLSPFFVWVATWHSDPKIDQKDWD